MVLSGINQRWTGTWEMYDDLIDAVPDNLSVLECLVGAYWTLVRQEKGIGIAKTLTGGRDGPELCNTIGMPLKKLAGYVKSWSYLQASLGMAAINAALNNQNHVEEISEPSNSNVFHYISYDEFVGKKVATVGHYPVLDALREICELSIISKTAHGDEYPEEASEAILPAQDIVYITGTTLLYKTAPHLIELSKNAKVILVGASVPLCRILFDYGVDMIAGVVVDDGEKLWQAVREGNKARAMTVGTQPVLIQR